MCENVPTIVLMVPGPTSPRRESELRRWLRALVPAALVLFSSAPIGPETPEAVDDVVTLTAEEVDAGPLAIAAALARPRPARDDRAPVDSRPGLA